MVIEDHQYAVDLRQRDGLSQESISGTEDRRICPDAEAQH
jgi:hypothetical protein